MKERKVVFKRYVQNQPMLLPPSYEDLVPRNYRVRVVNEVIERIDIGALERSYTELQGRRDARLSSADAAEGAGVCVLAEYLFVTQDRAGVL